VRSMLSLWPGLTQPLGVHGQNGWEGERRVNYTDPELRIGRE